MPPGAASDTSVAAASLIDAHTHLWELSELERFLDAAARNFDRVERRLVDGERPARVLLLMQTGDRGLFAAGESLAVGGGWRLGATEEEGSLRAERGQEEDAEEPLLLVEGRQVATAEGLELLATPWHGDLEEGLPVRATVTAVREAGAVALLPWGFGKWWGSRGRVVTSLLESVHPSRLLIGDNGGRPRFGPKPRLLTLAAQRGFHVVRGSDPLPIAGEVERAGSFGSLVRGDLDRRRPAAAVRLLLRRLVGQPRPFGRGAGLVTFVIRQLRLFAGGRGR